MFDTDGDGAVSLEEFVSGAAHSEVVGSMDEAFEMSVTNLTSAIPPRSVLVSQAANFVFETTMTELYAIIEEMGEEAFEERIRRRLFFNKIKDAWDDLTAAEAGGIISAIGTFTLLGASMAMIMAGGTLALPG